MTFDSWENELYHHGIKGMKWGIRRYQNSDGSLTEEGLARYGEKGQWRSYTKTLDRNLKRLNKDTATNFKLNKQYTEAGSKNKADKIYAKLKENERQLSESRKKINETLESARKKGYSVSEQQDIYLVNVATGKDYAKSILFGALGGAVLGVGDAYNRKMLTGENRSIVGAALTSFGYMSIGALGGAVDARFNTKEYFNAVSKYRLHKK